MLHDDTLRTGMAWREGLRWRVIKGGDKELIKGRRELVMSGHNF